MERTIEEWLQTIADPEIREKALNNLKEKAGQKETSLQRAIRRGFVWNDTKEGFLYWNDIAEKEIEENIETRECPERKDKNQNQMKMDKITELQEQIDSLQKQLNQLKEEPKEVVLPQSWEEIEQINGWFVNADSKIYNSGVRNMHVQHRNIWPTRELAEAALALSQLCMLRSVWVKGYEEIGWSIVQTAAGLVIFECPFSALSFPTREMTEQFRSTPKIAKLLKIALPLL